MPLATDSVVDDVADTQECPGQPATADTLDASGTPPTKPPSNLRAAILFGVAIVAVCSALAGWLGFRDYQAHQWQSERSEFVAAARQGATNLTSIDWQQADQDVQRILDGATGGFYDDFAKHAQPFVDVVKKTKSTTVGTVTEAGIESQSQQGAQVLVAVTVTTSSAVAPQPDPHGWRLRVAVERLGGQTKVSKVEFVR